MAIRKKSTKQTAARKNARTKKPVSAASQSTAGVSDDWKVRVRMYRKWLGDCFLLTFRNGDNTNHVMIDCGALVGTPQGKDKVNQAVDEIAAETGGNLAALVVTHEHWDHVSGFSDAIDGFKKFSNIGAVWAAWTEDPNQTVAQENKRLRIAAVQSALVAWNASADQDDQQRGEAVCGLMEFLAPGGLAAFSESTDAAMHAALDLGPRKLLSPGDIVDDIPGLRVYVLGPPKNIQALHKMIGTVGKDMYGTALVDAQIATINAFAAAAACQTDPTAMDHYVPFEPYLHWDENTWSNTFKELADSYKTEPKRRIDADWLNSAAELALQLDSYTNNTSLVLAFELTDSREVLLFVGDAQMGNWQSWANVHFEDANVSTTDLLERTIFYKVGHHGSHNATLKDGGLELMSSPKLVAAIPVDEAFARNSKHWDMPADALLKAIQEKTRGRILRGDSDFPAGAPKPDALSDQGWAEFQQNVNIQDHFVEYYVR